MKSIYKGFLKKIIYLLLISIFFVQCKGKYADIVDTMEDYIQSNERFQKKILQAQNKDQVLLALQSYMQDINKLIPKFRSLDKKYPDLSRKLTVDDKNLPKEILDIQQKLLNSLRKIADAKFEEALTKYADVPEVAKELEKMSQTLQKLSGDPEIK